MDSISNFTSCSGSLYPDISPRLPAIPMTVFPLIGAFGVLFWAGYRYHSKFPSDLAFTVCLILGTVLSILAVGAAWGLARFTQRELYGVPRPPKMTLRLSEAKLRLFASASPAAVKQPNIEGDVLPVLGPFDH